MKKTTKSSGGTSFFNSTIKTSLNILKNILGEPQWSDNTGEDKSNFDWTMENEDENIFTVYDWKEYRIIEDNEIIEWHIGGFNNIDTEKAKAEIEQAIKNI